LAHPEKAQPRQQPKDDDDAPAAVPAAPATCPFCGSREVELFSLFGAQLSTDEYYCRACRTPFERFSRDDGATPPA
jgi:hypothetical protein